MSKDCRDAFLSLFDLTGRKKDFSEAGGIVQAAKALLDGKQKQWQMRFELTAQDKVANLMNQLLRESRASCVSSMKPILEDITIKSTAMSPQLKEIFQASVTQSVDLIKSIPTQYFERISGDIMRTITTPNSSFEQLSASFTRYGNMSTRRANMVAMDQTRKAYQSFNRQLLDDGGIKKGIWIHTGGAYQPRKRHKAFSGETFDLQKGAPVGDDGGNYVFPGQEINCRCTFKPVIEI